MGVKANNLKDFQVIVEYAARCYFPVWFKIKAGSSIERKRAVPQAIGNFASENEWKRCSVEESQGNSEEVCRKGGVACSHGTLIDIAFEQRRRFRSKFRH